MNWHGVEEKLKEKSPHFKGKRKSRGERSRRMGREKEKKYNLTQIWGTQTWGIHTKQDEKDEDAHTFEIWLIGFQKEMYRN